VLPNYVRVQGDAGWLEWDWTANTVRVRRAAQGGRGVKRVEEAGQQCAEGADGGECVAEERAGEEEKTEVVAGDSWVTGGVKDTLADALRQCALYEGGRVATYKVDERTHLCAAEEGLRDACVVFCMAHAAAAASPTGATALPSSCVSSPLGPRLSPSLPFASMVMWSNPSPSAAGAGASNGAGRLQEKSV
jgi:hypothetical protein